jgi:hypothetical protein
MTLSGPEALKSLDEALRDIRREEDEIAKRLARSAELVAKFRESESELFRELARVRLDPSVQDELTGKLTQAEVKARDMLARHAQSLETAEAELKGLDARIAALATERAGLVGKSTELQAQLRALADRISAEAMRDPAYVEKRQAADRLAEIAAESIGKTEQAEADRELKGKPYRDDPLFMYLWERGYGTRNYRVNNLIAYLDSLVAGMVGYPEARVNFAMLNEIPLRLREHAERQRQIADAALAEVEALEDKAIDAAGGKPIRDALAAAETRMAAIDEDTVKLEDQRDELARRQRDLAQGADPAFAEAVAGLAGVLGREDIRTLLAEARATRTTQDDTIVQQVDDLRQRTADEDSDSREQKARLKTLASRRRELEDIQYEFKKQGFDNPRSTFREDNLVGDVLTDFLRGGITAADYWGRWRKSQNWTGGNPGNIGSTRSSSRDNSGFQWPDSSFGGGSSSNRSSGGFGGSWGRLPGGGGSRSGGGSSGGGLSRPRTGSSGNRTSGGFKTGGGF